MALLFGLLLLILQADFLASECNADNCDVDFCNGVHCSRCQPGYFKQFSYCINCYLYCKRCNGGLCYSCQLPNCLTNICDYANCGTMGCSENDNARCSGCPDGFYMKDNFCFRCDNINCKCTSATGCDECLPGHYGSNFCNSNCSTGCLTCLTETHCTDCIDGKYGHSCNLNCESTCENGACDKNSGTCVGDCASDEYLESGKCKDCPLRCSSCVNATYCSTCRQDFNWNSICAYDCSGCLNRCNRNDGCSAGCDDPWYYKIYNPNKKGYECIRCFNQCKACDNETHCTSCKDNFWGRQCQYNCNNCNGGCDKDSGCVTNCEIGYYRIQVGIGYECKQCSDYCEECLDSSKCKVCKDPSKCYSCRRVYYGDNCEHRCSQNCKTTEDGIHECLQPNGVCTRGCTDNYWTKTCTETCADGCINQTCNDISGVCLHGCKSGYHGVNCSLKCPDNCFESKCLQNNGTCVFECIQGSTDSRCMKAAERSKVDEGDSIAGPAGAGAGAAVVILMVIVIVVLFIRRRRHAAEKDGHDNISLDDQTHALAIENNAYATVNDAKTNDGNDTIILNEKSPAIMTKPLGNMNVGQHPTPYTWSEPSGSKKRSGSKKPMDDKTKYHQKQSSKGVSTAIQETQLLTQKPEIGKHVNTNDRNTDQLTKKQPEDNANEAHTQKTAEHTGNTFMQPDETESKLNKVDDDMNEEDNTYYNTVGKRVPVSELTDYVNAKSYEGIENEFAKIPRGLLKPYSVAKTSRNAEKNRYKMIYPYDESRVVLKDGGNDYVNASYIEGFNKQREYIAAAGPFLRKDKKETTTDFWRMIWQEKCETIVMLTKCVENAEPKCDQYWPDLGENKQYGKLHVTCVTEDQYADFTVRSFVVAQNETTLNICQIHFTAWPDKGVPADVTCMIEYRQKVRSLYGGRETPMLVHCSAGIGRTGTFIALDIQTFQGETRGYVDIFGCVANLRQQRVNLVQTPEQYEYLHLAILHALTFDCKSIPAEEIITNYSKIIKTNGGSSEIDQQFKKFASTLEALSVEESNKIAKNKAIKEKNRDGADIPGDENRVRLFEDRKPGSSDYINAVYINSFKTSNRFIVAQTPMPTTVVDFLSMIYQTNCSCVVSMEETDLQDKQTVGVFWPADNQIVKHGIFQVKCKESTTCDSYTLKKLSIRRKTGKKDEEKDVDLFIYSNWPRDAAVPKTSDSLIHLIKTVDKVNNTHNEDKEIPIIVHCMNGAHRSCLYCAVSVLIEKMEIEHEVSVVNTLRQIKSRRRSAFPTLEQYKFCHQAMISYLQTFDTYSNFELTTRSSNEDQEQAATADVVYAKVKK